MRAIFALITASLLTLPGPTRAEGPFVNDAEPAPPSSIRDGEAWKEQSLRLPPWPSEANRIEVKVDDPGARFRYYIDKPSLQTGADGVVRYTLITVSESGAQNLSYEGIRCTPSGRFKIYAYGIGGRFAPTSVGDEWQIIDKTGADRYRYDLWRHYLCVPRKFVARSTRDQLHLLKTGRVPMEDNTGFSTY